ncbi:glycosyltransferase family 2 protein [Donghicola eburneus]|nr:glycosyltransferase family 2 protein [Donghicola eburneus]
MTVKEPAPLVMANVGWHLSLGATEVHVYLDDPEDSVADQLEVVDRVNVIRCDDAHWDRMTVSPTGTRQTRRQGVNATDAYRRTKTDWMIHLDADEFLMPERPIGQLVAEYARKGRFLRIPPWERTYLTSSAPQSLFEGGFRLPYVGKLKDDQNTFWRATPFLTKGLTGHSVGKALVPTGKDWRIGIHSPREGERRLLGDYVPEIALLHFDGMTPLHWMLKVLRYAHLPREVVEGMLGGHRREQVLMALRRSQSHARLLQFHNRLKVTDGGLRARLEARDMFVDAPFEPAEQIAAHLGYTPDLSVDGFDALLRERASDLLDRLK